MANKKITSLTELTTPAVGDFIPIVDVSDTTDSAQGTTKKITTAELGIPVVVYKSADETVNSSSTYQDDDSLKFAIGASEVWAFTLSFTMTSGTTPDFKYQFSVPSGATHNFWSGSTLAGVGTGTTQSAVVIPGAGATVIHEIAIGTVVNSSNAGYITFQWAQNTLNASDTKVLAGSYIIAHRLA